MKTREFEGIKIRIDRPKGFVQKGKDPSGKEWSRTYLYDYGYIPKTNGGDDEGLDVYLGPDGEGHSAHWVMQQKEDGTFDEYKVFLGFKDKEAAKKAYFAHTPRKFYVKTVTMTVPMMKALLGLEPAEKLAQLAMFQGFMEEMEAICRG